MIERSVEISFEFDGKNYPAFDGETIAAALLRSNVLNIDRKSTRLNSSH